MSESVALGANVGTAWVALRFSARGARAQIASQLKAETAGMGVVEGEAVGSNFTKSFGKRMAGVSKTAKDALLPIAKWGTATFAAVGIEAARMGTSFQSAMEKVHTQAGASQVEVDKMSKAILNLASVSQHGPQQLAEGLYHLESLGLRGAKALDALRVSEHLAAVSGADLEETTSAIGGAWRTGVKGAQSFAKSASTLNAIVGAGNMRMADLLGALGTGILPSAKTFGLSLNQVGAALALFTDEGVPAVDAATRLRMSFSLLGAPSKLAEAQLKTIGLTGLQLANTMRDPSKGLIGAIQLLKDHLDASGLSASKQAALLSRAFGGGRSSSAILSMINNLDVLKKKQDQVNSSAGNFGKAVIAQRKTAEAQWHYLASNVESIMTKLGVALLPATTKFAHFLNTKVLPAGLNVARQISHAFQAIIPFDAIKHGWNDLMRFFGLDQSKASPNGGVFSGRSPALIHPLNHSKASPSKSVFSGQSSALIRPLAGSVGKSVSNAFAHINWSDLVAQAIRGAANSAQKIGAAILSLFEKVNWTDLGKKAVFAFVPFVVGFVDNLLNALVSEAIHHPLDMLVFITSVIPIGRAAGIILKLFGKIKFIGPLLKLFLGPIEKAGGIVESAFGKMLKKIFGPTVDRILGYFKGALGWLKSKGEDIILGIWYGIEHEWPKVTGFLGKIYDYTLKPFVNAAKWLLQAGGHIIEGMLGGISAKMSDIGSWIKGNIVDPVINWVKHFFGIHSPSTVFHGIGFNLIAGLFRGMMSHDITGFVTKLFGSMPKALGSIVGKGLISITNLPSKALHALEGLGGSLLGKLGGIFGKLFGGGGGSGVQKWAGLVSQVLGMLGLPASYLGPWLTQMQTESGGNPRAINLTDINAQNGDPSRGLLQVIGSTFNAYAGKFAGLGIYNPLANIYAAINYALHRYGRVGMLGVIGHGHGYDSGGIANGMGFLPKYTPKPERVLSPSQTSAFERLVNVLTGTGGSSRPKRMRVEFDPRTMEMWIRDLSVQEARGEIAFASGKR